MTNIVLLKPTVEGPLNLFNFLCNENLDMEPPKQAGLKYLLTCLVPARLWEL